MGRNSINIKALDRLGKSLGAFRSSVDTRKITLFQVEVLCSLGLAEEMSNPQLEKYHQVARPTIGRAMDSLRLAGLCGKRMVKHENHKFVYFVTEEGYKVIEEMVGPKLGRPAKEN